MLNMYVYWIGLKIRCWMGFLCWVCLSAAAVGSNRPDQVAAGNQGRGFGRGLSVLVFLVDALLVVFPSGYENTTAPLSSKSRR